MKQPDLYHFEVKKLTSKPTQSSEGILACSCILHIKFYKACDVFLALQNSIGQAVS